LQDTRAILGRFLAGKGSQLLTSVTRAEYE